jgi:hypothetical protein
MKTTLRSFLRAPFAAWVFAGALLAGCGGGGGGGATAPVAPVSQNRAPTGGLALSGVLVSAGGAADAGTFSGSDVKFDASASADPDGDALSFSWTLVSKPSGSNLTVQNTTALLVVKPDVAGTYVVSVRISDGKGASVDKQASIVVSANAAPVSSVAVSARYTAVPTVAATTKVTVGATLLLDGSNSRDADGDPVSTSWDVIESPVASRASLIIDGTNARLSTDVAGVYKIRARATDPSGAYSEAVYPFEAVGTAPTVVAVASIDNGPVNAGSSTINGTTGYAISLSGAGSSNPDGMALTYAWTLVSKPAASTAVLDSTTGAFSQLTPDVLGDYVVRMVITAPSGIASSYTTTVSVKNRRPVAAIGTNAVPVALPSGPTLRMPVNTLVTLRGTASSDADGDTLTYAWTLQSKPAGSAASLSGTNLSTAQLTTDLSGSYIVVLRVTDSAGAYSEKTLIIASGNAAPVAVVDKGRMTVLAGTATTASAAYSFDDDGDTLSYSWALDAKPAASAATISSSGAQLSFTPDVVGTYVASVTVNDGKASSIAYVTIKAVSSTVTTTSLPFTPLISRYSRGLDRLVTISAAPNLLSIVDPFSGTLRQIPLPAVVKSLNLSPDGKLAAVLHEGAVSLVDLDNGLLVRSSATNGSQTEAIVTNAALIYLAGQTGSSWSNTGVKVVNGKTGEDVTATYGGPQSSTYFGSNARGLYSSVKRTAYFGGDGYSEIYYFPLDAAGVAGTVNRSPYYSSSTVTQPLFLSANEDLLFTGSGTYYRTDTLAYVGTLGLANIDSLSHSASADEAIAVVSTKSWDYSGSWPYLMIRTYESSYHRFTGSLFFADANITLPVIGGSQSYGLSIYHAANDKHVAVVQTGGAASNAANLKYYVAVTR